MGTRRKILLAVSAGALFLLVLFSLFDYDRTWRLWSIPAMSPYFADLRVITHGADSVLRGLDPLISNPADPWGRPLNYPRIWQGLYSLGINSSHTLWLGLVIIVSFLLGVVMVLPSASNLTICLVMGAILSPAVLLGIERANIDLFIFFLVATAIISVRKSAALGGALIVFATVLKLFPVFAISLLLRMDKRTFFKHASVVLLILSVWFAATWTDLRLISHATPRGTNLSYGMNVGWMRIAEINYSLGSFFQFVYLSLAMIAIGLAFFFACIRTPGPHGPLRGETSLSLDAFRVGSSIYIGTFLLGNNFDYRLLFLIFTIPQLACWLASPIPILRRCSQIALCVMFVSMWGLLISRFWLALASIFFESISRTRLLPWILHELSSWTLFMVLAYLFFLVLPKWVTDLLLHPVRMGRRPDATHDHAQP
ncbi:hypothetical protein [Variovorax sp. J31P207]|uniref:hypothetical protein n=1 Tax=Variovorax sp. J31P207 TaxID=3053510 RepID=UPI002578503B|nr:hypothetical protein [Variovorax sp. J31P207]MDM0068070.1 hypothetical protein [Variovorax sp. J31P207]